MHCLNMTPLAREHAERLAREDAAKAEKALRIRRDHVRIWHRNGARTAGLLPVMPRPRKPRASRPCSEAAYQGRKRKIERVLAELQNHPDGVNPAELGRILDLDPATARSILFTLCHRGEVVNRESEMPTARGMRRVTLFFLPPTATPAPVAS